MAATSRPSFQSRRYAMGGPMSSASQSAPGPQGPPPGAEGDMGGAGPEQQIQAALQQYAQTKDPQLAVQICDMLVSMSGGGMAPAAEPGMDPGMAGGMPPQGAQMARKGGKLRAFESKGPKAEKPAFGAPSGKNAPQTAGKPGVPAKGGRPMSADEKIKAKRALSSNNKR